MPSLSHLPETIPFIHPFPRSSKFGDESQCEVDNVGSCLLLGLLKFLWPKLCTAWRSSQPTGIGVPGRCVGWIPTPAFESDPVAPRVSRWSASEEAGSVVMAKRNDKQGEGEWFHVHEVLELIIIIIKPYKTHNKMTVKNWKTETSTRSNTY